MAKSDHGTEAIYPMSAVSRMTGLSPDTIRVWERRYGAVEPERTEGRARRYSSADIRRLSLMKAASENGHSLSNLAKLDVAQLEQLCRECEGGSVGGQALAGLTTFLAEYLSLVERFRVFEAARLLSRAAAVMESREFVREVVLPLLTDVGNRWESGRFLVVHEHIISEQVRHLLYSIQYRAEHDPSTPLVLVATPPGHRHEFGAVIGTYIAASQGLRCVFLGADVPWADMAIASKELGADLLVLSVVRGMNEEEEEDLRGGVTKLAVDVPIWLGIGKAGEGLPRQANLRIFSSFEEFDSALRLIGHL